MILAVRRRTYMLIIILPTPSQ